MDSTRTTNAHLHQQCVYFLRGRCRFGTRCKFSHTVGGQTASSGQNIKHRAIGTEHNEMREDVLHTWRRLLTPPPFGMRRPLEKGNTFFQLALELMEGDVGASQETIRLMAKDDGLGFIRDLAEYHIPNAATQTEKANLALESAVLEQEVATLYNFMQGIGGRRMKLIFDFVIGLLDTWSLLPRSSESESEFAICKLGLAVLAKMVDCITTNVVNEHFEPILLSFEALTIATGDVAGMFFKMQAQKHLDYIKRRLRVGDSMSLTSGPQQSLGVRAEYIMRRDLPGHLSTEGPRHDNDHADIVNIRILPTKQEIASPRGEYLPMNDTSLFHVSGIRGRLDREFRLLREDTVGQLRDAVRAQLESMQSSTRERDIRGNNGLKTHVYRGADIEDIRFEKQTGLDLLVRFRQPLSGKDHQKRHDWWAQSKRLQPGGLVCVISQNSIYFCTVAESTKILPDSRRELGQRAKDGTETLDPKFVQSLAGDDKVSYVHLHIAEPARSTITQALSWYRKISDGHQRFLVEFPGVLLPSFQHTLRALQCMSQKPSVPFTKLIAPESEDIELTTMDPPQYSVKPGFFFDLTCLTHDGTDLRHSYYEPLDARSLATHSTLDETQSIALLNALSRGLALIQGPPGTGKSFTGEKLIKTLLANKKCADLGPILCVCYTNHALDQLLEHLHKDGVKQIIRIGSRSKSEILENLNLRVLSQMADRTRGERHALWTSETNMDEYVPHITQLLGELARSQTTSAIEEYLKDRHPEQWRTLFGADSDGFQRVMRRKNSILDEWRRGGSDTGLEPRAVSDLVNSPVLAMSRAERCRIYKYWLRSIRGRIIGKISANHTTYTEEKERRDNIRQDVDLRCLSSADVVGVTTTSLAKNLNLLQRLRCKVMLCEEAGEVLEAHTLTALLPSVEHAILIGDHQQLRPQIQNYELQSSNPRGSRYSLDVSLFERLVDDSNDGGQKLPFDTLVTQRRMHPQISELIRATLYPALEDGGEVFRYPDIVGMKRRLFWLHHEAPEDREIQLDPSTTSHTNSFELQMTIAIVQHLVRQGSYGPDDIAVITPYLGQLHQLRRLMQAMFEISVGERDLEELDALEAEKHGQPSVRTLAPKGATKTTLLRSIRLATVDNFQGEEAKVVVVSLVRSNQQNKCGFLSTTNRINVLLSRAQHGMYIIGNSRTYGQDWNWSFSAPVTQTLRSLFRSPITSSSSPLKEVATCAATNASHAATLASIDAIRKFYTAR
ncbi:hypothetical protein JX266_007591 [Neoarthrinium moseri]|nr:hypothetical protein JX266_007591 [Neoarthrinium moseri]